MVTRQWTQTDPLVYRITKASVSGVLFGGENQGTLVLAVCAVSQHHEFAGGDGSKSGLDEAMIELLVHESCFGCLRR